jgi:hypothetical protein
MTFYPNTTAWTSAMPFCLMNLVVDQGLNRFAVIGAPNVKQCLIERIETAVNPTCLNHVSTMAI